MKNNSNIKLIIFDLSGTIIDFGSLATIDAMKNVFKKKKNYNYKQINSKRY